MDTPTEYLFRAAKSGDLQMVRNALANKDANVLAVDMHGRTPLHYAILSEQETPLDGLLNSQAGSGRSIRSIIVDTLVKAEIQANLAKAKAGQTTGPKYTDAVTKRGNGSGGGRGIGGKSRTPGRIEHTDCERSPDFEGPPGELGPENE